MVKSVLFVCTGNTCRSVMAEYLLRHYAKEAALELKVASAGLAAFSGSCAAENTLAVLREKDIEAEGHRAQAIHSELLEKFDLILTMTKAHKEQLVAANPAIGEKVFLLKEFPVRKKFFKEELAEHTEKDYEVSDPFGQSVDVYRRTREEISETLKAIIKGWIEEGDKT